MFEKHRNPRFSKHKQNGYVGACVKSVFREFVTIPDQFRIKIPYIIPYITSYIEVRDCPCGICCRWVRGGWDLDALGKFFRRRRRRRPRPRH